MFLYAYDAHDMSHVQIFADQILSKCDVSGIQQFNQQIQQQQIRYWVQKLAILSLDTVCVYCGRRSSQNSQVLDNVMSWLNKLLENQEWVGVKLLYRKKGMDALYNMLENGNGHERIFELAMKIIACALSSNQQQQQKQGQEQLQIQDVGKVKVSFWKLLCVPFNSQQLESLNANLMGRLFGRIIEELSSFAVPQEFLCSLSSEQLTWQNGICLLGNLLTMARVLLKGSVPGWWTTGSSSFCQVLVILMKSLPVRQLLKHNDQIKSASPDDEEDIHDSHENHRFAYNDVDSTSLPEQFILPLTQLQNKGILNWVITSSFPYTDASATDVIGRFTLSNEMIYASQLLLEILRCDRLQLQVQIQLISANIQLVKRLWFSGLRQSWWQCEGLAGESDTKNSQDASNWIEVFGLCAKVLSTYVRSAFDDSFYEEQHIFRLEEIYRADAPEAGVLAALKFILVQNCWVQKMNYTAKFVASYETLKACTQLFIQLYERNSRREFCPREAFHSRTIRLKKGVQEGGGFSRRQQLQDYQNTLNDTRVQEVLKNAPFLIDFEERVKLFRSNVDKDRFAARRMQQDFMDAHGIVRPNFITVRRNMILEDGFAQCDSLGQALKQQIRFRFVDEHGIEEAGVDGGGLCKDFLESLLMQAFNSEYGLFVSTSDNQLYPNPASISTIPDALRLYTFLGRMLGKAIYEGIIVELPLAHFFLKKILQMSTDVNDMTTLDAELYSQLIHLSRYAGNVEDLCLTFSVSSNEFGENKEIDLVPNGRNIPVTNENVLTYVYRVSDYKLRRQIHVPTQAFLQGFFELIDPQWVRIFSAQELHMLIAGSSEVIDLEDMQLNTEYSGGYHQDHPSIQFFWRVLRSFSPQQQRQVLRFVTACSRAPLLGFQHLNPRFCIFQAAPDADGGVERLPTASTCINLLKLPPYDTEEQMYSKLLFAVSQTEGFGLS
eukprot:TRINITY_DN33104_c0_g1_i6.p1 TRINITY_DN33104_c0_g1~~TRINITY_DN33104_c0_g1_i6.p1  ORF type:complete len:1059 (-),score=115.94 TRINITY_DN33104_c0_g1_i6:269-3109(-)